MLTANQFATITIAPPIARSQAHLALSIHGGYRVIETETHMTLQDRLSLPYAKALVNAWNEAAKSEVR